MVAAAMLQLMSSPIAQAATADDKLYVNFLRGSSTSIDASGGPPPWSLGASTKIIPALTLARRWETIAAGRDLDLYQVSLGLVIAQEISPHWGLVAVQQSSWRAAEGTKFSLSKQVAHSGVFLASYRPRGDLRFRVSAGMVVTLQNQRTHLRPAAGIFYESLDRGFYGELGFPYSNLIWRGHRGLEYGLSAQIDIHRYHLNAQDWLGAPSGAEYLRLSHVYLGPAVSAPLTSITYLNFKLGADLLRSTEFADENLDRISGAKTHPPAAWFVKVGVSVRFGNTAKSP